ncbi:MAG: hypothetical protein Q3963_07445, partial [Coriobacteriaceae bacterium]|nr:hypothetical protein [Coriobacteriaceae bacterium]
RPVQGEAGSGDEPGGSGSEAGSGGGEPGGEAGGNDPQADPETETVFVLTFGNTPGVALPHTGGPGIGTLVFLSVILMTAAVVLLSRNRRFTRK